MPKRAICYVTDTGFLFPSLVSIKTLHEKSQLDDASIYLFLVDIDEDTTELVKHATKRYHLRTISMKSSELFGGIDLTDFNKTHVPVTTLARFFVEPHLPLDVEEIIYIDGDTLITGNLDELIQTKLPSGRFLAAEDISSFCRHDYSNYGRVVREYFKGIGITEKYGYFNAGVFKTSRKSWVEIGSEAFRFFLDNTKICRFHDQSALNGVVKDRRLVMSSKYNFQTPFLHWGLEEKISPSLYHFTQSPKPWMGDCLPWGRFFEVYQGLEEERSALSLPIKRLSESEIGAHTKVYFKANMILRGPLLLRLLNRRRQMMKLEGRAFLK
jgi:lipopolysaccharide biosynthesis glycosyltransferase